MQSNRRYSASLLVVFLLGILPSFGQMPLQPHLTFPHIANGSDLSMELVLTSAADVLINGRIRFFDDNGSPLLLPVGGEAVSQIVFSIPAGGVFRVATSGTGRLRSGYAQVFTEDSNLDLSGVLVFNLAQSEVSVTPTRASAEFHVAATFDNDSDTGAAIANLSLEPMELVLLLVDQDGQVVANRTVLLGPRAKTARFLSQFFPELEPGFLGTLQVFTSRGGFHFLGLRQRRTGVLAAVSGAPRSFAPAGSQLFFLVDSGVNLLTGEFSAEELESSTIAQLTGIEQARIDNRIRIFNRNHDEAVTLHIRYFNDRCQDILNFLLVLECGQELRFDPFNLNIPGFPIGTRGILFGGEAPFSSDSPFPYAAARLRSGRLVITATAVGASTSDDNFADLRFPNENALIGQCGVTPINTGLNPGPRDDNLWVCNARPMSFNFLVGDARSSRTGEACRGPRVVAGMVLRDATNPLLELLDEGSAPRCLQVPQPIRCDALASLRELGSNRCDGQEVPASVIRVFGAPQFELIR